ncbi:MAG: Fe2+-dependent dioxygenase [Prochlorotrichaceae cyanobacterium]|jgi:PKHD-type hydroxylase
MLFQILDLLSPPQIQDIDDRLQGLNLVDGRTTAGWYARTVKGNEQVSTPDPIGKEIKAEITQALLAHPLFQAAVRPRRLHSLLISRYGVGMSYGRHVDNALMAGEYRSDLSFTVFLSDPQTYGGGELVIEGADSEQTYKLGAGSAIVYPSTTLHRVNPITAGERWAVVGWVESWIRQAEQREILFDLETVQRSLFAQGGKTPEFDLVSKSLSNLLRQWLS